MSVMIVRRSSYIDGKQRTGRRYTAEFRDADGRQVCETLGVSNKSQARRLAIEIQQRLDNGTDKMPEATIIVDELADRYFDLVKAKGVAPKTEWKYRADLSKLKEYCREMGPALARRFSADDLYRIRQWLIKKEYTAKTFRHHFASLCADHGVAHRKALAWLGHSSSDMLDLYYHLRDDDSQQAMLALAAGAESMSIPASANTVSEGSLRAVEGSRIEKLLQVQEFQELVDCLEKESEREGLVLAHFCNLFRNLTLSPNLRCDKDFARLADVLFLHGFLPSQDAF